jgi:hypothetical protein
MNNGSGLKDIFAPICESGRMLVIVIADVHGPWYLSADIPLFSSVHFG